MKTNFNFINSNKKETVVLTTGLLWSVEKSKSLKSVIDYFKEKQFSIYAFDMYAHWKTEWNIEDFTLSKVYNQLFEIKKYLEENWKQICILYWVSASALPLIKFWIEHKVNKIILRSPAIEMYAKRNRELWLEKMLEWKKNWKIELWKDFKTWESIYFKYKFILDVLENFHCISFSNWITKIFIWSWKEDLEVPFYELNILAKKNKNISLIWYKWEKHSFSEEWMKKFIKDIDNFLNW
jgi:hypothetical protein